VKDHPQRPIHGAVAKETLVAKTTILAGMLLTILGVIFYAFAFQMGATSRSVTALIPTFVGVPLILLGYGVLLKPDLRMHLMHVAVLLGLLGFLASFGRFAMVMARNPNLGPATIASLLMAIICGVFVVLCVRSFIAARRARQEGKN
jgi:hypothetical protein